MELILTDEYLLAFGTSAVSITVSAIIVVIFSNVTDNHGIVYELFLIVYLTTYCMNSDRNVIIKNDSCL